MPAFMWLTARERARVIRAGQGYDAVMRGDVIYTNGWLYRAMVLAARMLPQRLVTGLMQRNAKQFRKVLTAVRPGGLKT